MEHKYHRYTSRYLSEPDGTVYNQPIHVQWCSLQYFQQPHGKVRVKAVQVLLVPSLALLNKLLQPVNVLRLGVHLQSSGQLSCSLLGPSFDALQKAAFVGVSWQALCADPNLGM